MAVPSFGVSRTFDTALERLWVAFTDARQIAQWAPPPDWSVVRNDMKLSVGGTYRFGLRAPDDRTFWAAWEIRRVEPPSLVTFVHAFTDEQGTLGSNPLAPGWPQKLRGEIRCALQGGGATVTVNLAPLDASGSESSAFRAAFSAMSQGWERALDRLEAYLQHG